MPDPSTWGVQEGYWDASRQWRTSPNASVDEILQAMGACEHQLEPPRGPVLFVREGEQAQLGAPALLRTEDGAELRIDDRLPPDLPLGYHSLLPLDDEIEGPVAERRVGERQVGERRIVVSPGRCPLPEGPAWGWSVQLYAARSTASWGMGDLANLREIANWSAGTLGAGIVLVNPLHAAIPGLPQPASPYFPSSRRFRNPLYLRVEEVPGAAEILGDDLERLASAGRALNGDRHVDRDSVWKLKLEALERVWEARTAGRFSGERRGPWPELGAWRAAQGEALERYATFCALSEVHGRPWRRWPASLRHPDLPGVTAFASEHRSRLGFHSWLQWLVDVQLSAASEAGVDVVHDLAIGVDPDGADAWMWQDVLADDIAVGAPPDEFNTRGQTWGVPPFDPWRLRAASYEPFVQTIRAAVAHGAGVRLDHIMGLFRLFWIPRGRPPAEGAYVRYPARELLDIVGLECHRAGAFVVGEDLGTVEDEVRAELADRRVMGCRLMLFEDWPPSAYPKQAMASVSTHDLPTVAGIWSGSDLEDQLRLGMEPSLEATETMRRRIRDLAGVNDDAPPNEVTEGLYSALGTAPCLLLTAALDDALDVSERPNMPGTVDSWPNWSIALPDPLEDVMADPRASVIARALSRAPRTEEAAG